VGQQTWDDERVQETTWDEPIALKRKEGGIGIVKRQRGLDVRREEGLVRGCSRKNTAKKIKEIVGTIIRFPGLRTES